MSSPLTINSNLHTARSAPTTPTQSPTRSGNKRYKKLPLHEESIELEKLSEFLKTFEGSNQNKAALKAEFKERKAIFNLRLQNVPKEECSDSEDDTLSTTDSSINSQDSSESLEVSTSRFRSNSSPKKASHVSKKSSMIDVKLLNQTYPPIDLKVMELTKTHGAFPHFQGHKNSKAVQYTSSTNQDQTVNPPTTFTESLMNPQINSREFGFKHWASSSKQKVKEKEIPKLTESEKADLRMRCNSAKKELESLEKKNQQDMQNLRVWIMHMEDELKSHGIKL